MFWLCQFRQRSHRSARLEAESPSLKSNRGLSGLVWWMWLWLWLWLCLCLCLLIQHAHVAYNTSNSKPVRAYTQGTYVHACDKQNQSWDRFWGKG